MPDFEISDVLREWPYDPERNVRRITASDGSEKLQVRLPLGIEQYELDGRPDGRRPEGCESYLDMFLERFKAEGGARMLSPEECALLYEEGVLYYFRYLLCFQIGDYDRVARDTRRNLRMFDLVHELGGRDEDKVKVDQYRPYVLRMLASALAMRYAGHGDVENAVGALNNAISEIERIEHVPGATFAMEKRRSLSLLRAMVEEMREQAPSETDQLRRRLKAAVEAEQYERAAKLRDVLRVMEKDG